MSFEETSNVLNRIHLFDCNGTEISLNECPHNSLIGGDFCGHAYDAGVICQEQYGKG